MVCLIRSFSKIYTHCLPLPNSSDSGLSHVAFFDFTLVGLIFSKMMSYPPSWEEIRCCPFGLSPRMNRADLSPTHSKEPNPNGTKGPFESSLSPATSKSDQPTPSWATVKRNVCCLNCKALNWFVTPQQLTGTDGQCHSVGAWPMAHVMEGKREWAIGDEAEL